jgi:NADPH:quinone reductase-like Zn-dependent oxidoreductase
LQAALNSTGGAQSLYEYEYETGIHKVLYYESFGEKPKDLLKIHSAKSPPVRYENGLIEFNRVVVQVEVSDAYVGCTLLCKSANSSLLKSQASTTSQTDCFIRRGEWNGKGQIPLPNSPGVDIVGRLYRIDNESADRYGLAKGDRVVALTKWGGNSRYLAVKPEELVKVPLTVDPAEAACLPETYLSAFQALHHGQNGAIRYKTNSLRGKSFLVVGPMTSNMGRALGQLGIIAGVQNLYATAKPKHYQRLTSMGILPLSQDPLDWYQRLYGKIDLIISLDEEVNPIYYKVLANTGEVLIMTHGDLDLTDEQQLFERRSRLVCSRAAWQNKSRTNSYDVFEEWENNLERSKKDLTYLVQLLNERKVTPHILDRIPLTKVARAHEIIESKRLPGFIVCEPWLVSKSRAVVL